MNEFERQWRALSATERRRTALMVAGILVAFFAAMALL